MLFISNNQQTYIPIMHVTHGSAFLFLSFSQSNLNNRIISHSHPGKIKRKKQKKNVNQYVYFNIRLVSTIVYRAIRKGVGGKVQGRQNLLSTFSAKDWSRDAYCYRIGLLSFVARKQHENQIIWLGYFLRMHTRILHA